jgi:hypothetical protein
MPTPNQENFKYYKKAESQALEILEEMKAATPKKNGHRTRASGRDF